MFLLREVEVVEPLVAMLLVAAFGSRPFAFKCLVKRSGLL